MNVKQMTDLELAKTFLGFGTKMDKTTKIARVAVLTELMYRPTFKQMCKDKGIPYEAFVKKAELLPNLK